MADVLERMPALPDAYSRLDAEFFARPVDLVARELVGCLLLRDGVGGVIVETEAYHESESACHAYRGPTPRAKVLFERPGTAYVYFSYGMHSLLNAVAEPQGVGAAVLIRAVEPVWGVDRMIQRRGRDDLRQLCSGPGKLTQALAVEMADNSGSLIDGPIAIHAPIEKERFRVVAVAPRIGISTARELEWRFCAEGSKHLSAPAQNGVADC